MHKPAPHEYPQSPYFSRYLEAVDGQNVVDLLTAQGAEVTNLFNNLTDDQQQFRYAPGKWSPKQLLGHMTDTERIFAYRMLAIARGEQQSLPGFDENAYEEAANFNDQPLADLLRQYELTRQGTIALAASFSPEAWERRGLANGAAIGTRVLAWLIAGHERHHLNVLRDRYGLESPSIE